MYFDYGMSPASEAAGRDVTKPYEESKVLPSTTETEQADNSKGKAVEAENAAELLTKHFSDLSKLAASSMAENFKAQKADPTKEQAEDLKEAREARTKAHDADVEEINAIKKEAEEAARKNYIVKAVITPKIDVYSGRTTYDFTTDLVNESQKPITDYAEQLTENPELTAVKTDGGIIYEDKDGRGAGYIRADGKLVVINNPDEHTASVSYTDTDGDGYANDVSEYKY